jgi:deferrochelatase/peroxidase EfeB
MDIDLHNVQAVVMHVLRRPIGRHMIFRFGRGEGARSFIRELSSGITTADVSPAEAPDPLLAIGISYNGLRLLGVDAELLATFDAVYKAGPDGHVLGDVPGSRSDPTTWWEGGFTSADVHCIVHVHVRSDDAANAATSRIRDLARTMRLTELIPRRDGTMLETNSLGGGKLHFGYTDGISQPDIHWDDLPDTPTRPNFRRFLLGYPTAGLSSAPRAGPAADLVRDSTYGMFRWVYQDVAAFNRFLSDAGQRLFHDLPPADAEELLAAKLMGRWRDGTPVVLSPDGPDPALATSNDFGYAEQDPDGHRCPFSSHIRVVNPRDTPLDPAVVDGVPRLLRRGMPYGPPLTGEDDDGVDRGLVGIFLCADLRLQVYTLMRWIKRNNFSPVYDPNRRAQDALAGNRFVPGASREFRIPRPGGTSGVVSLPDFIHTKGTAFLLYPSRTTLAALSRSSSRHDRTRAEHDSMDRRSDL